MTYSIDEARMQITLDKRKKFRTVGDYPHYHSHVMKHDDQEGIFIYKVGASNVLLLSTKWEEFK